jgi:hypothetical protein
MLVRVFIDEDPEVRRLPAERKTVGPGSYVEDHLVLVVLLFSTGLGQRQNHGVIRGAVRPRYPAVPARTLSFLNSGRTTGTAAAVWRIYYAAYPRARGGSVVVVCTVVPTGVSRVAATRAPAFPGPDVAVRRTANRAQTFLNREWTHVDYLAR